MKQFGLKKIFLVFAITIFCSFYCYNAISASLKKDSVVDLDKSEINVIEGTLLSSTQNSLKLDIEGKVETFYITDKSTFWRGEETDVNNLKIGDRVMVRFNKDFTIERGWANLARVQGVIESNLKDSHYKVVGLQPGINLEIDVVVDERATFKDVMSQDFENTEAQNKKEVKTLSKGMFVDVIGLREGNMLRGTLIYYAKPGQEGMDLEVKSGSNTKQKSELNANTSAVKYPYATYTGYATWFDCNTGAGRCGTCSTSRSDQTAWPAMDSCGSCTWTCCDCSKGCKNQTYLSCGKSISVYDVCGKKTQTVYIADCGPFQTNLCSRTCSDCKGYGSPIIDLTKPTFAKFYDPAKRGCFSCEVTVR